MFRPYFGLAGSCAAAVVGRNPVRKRREEITAFWSIAATWYHVATSADRLRARR